VSADTSTIEPRGSGPCLTGVGLGPGDPELLTLRGVRAIRNADVVFVPVRRAGEMSYALTIAGDLVDRARQQVVTLPFPDASGDAGYRALGERVATELAPDRRGVFLVEGDPTLYSSFGHVARALSAVARPVQLEAVPGVSSITASAAAAGLSLADYAERIAILPATYHAAELEATLRDFDCVVLLKVAPVLRETLVLIERLGLTAHTTYVRRVGRPDQEVMRDVRVLAADPPRDYFSLLIVRRRTA
jgi:precorrin-2/cobalt-factor-2 C20-methyltransferase